MKVIVIVVKVEKFKPQPRAKIATDGAGWCCQAAIQLRNERGVFFHHTGYHPQEEGVVVSAIKEAMRTCPVLAGRNFEVDLSRIDGRLNTVQREELSNIGGKP